MKKTISILTFFMMVIGMYAHEGWNDSIIHEIDSIITKPYYTQIKKKSVVKKRGRKRTVWNNVNVRRNFTIGCCIYDLDKDCMLYSINNDKMMIPASTQKLYVAISMLKNRGRHFSLDTEVMTNGKEAADSLGRGFWDGDIYVKSVGNPALNKDDVMTVVKRIEALGYDSINGSIVLCDTEKSRRISEAKFVKDIANQLVNDGICFSKNKPWEVNDGMPSERCKRLCTLSTPMSDILNRMLKNSNNTYAESMFINLMEDDKDWSYDACKDIVRGMVSNIRHKYHSKNGDNDNLSDYYVIADGSGLSKQNRTTAQSQVDLLRYAYRSSKLFSELMNYLPVAGVDGTLSKRMNEGCPAYGNVFAKTGTVNNVSTLSGYARMSNGHKIAFSILINECPDLSFARALQDKICNLITR